MKIDNFFSELKRRNVYKVAVAYTIVGWLLVQVATQVFPFFEIPNWAVRLVVLAIVIGFPIALVIAWAFELTPEGLKRTEDVDLAAAAQRPRHRAWIFVVIIAGAMSLGLFFLGRMTAPGKQSGANEVSSKSIAVLPFVNMSSDKEQEYFSDGLSEELLNQLARIPQLRVIARTSSFSFKGKEVDVATIAKILNVANVLEGSVRKSANTLRITAQLVRASDSSHLWSHTY
ncbi:MAG: adenylyl cyclase, partial [Verrucomicrobiota bacterium]|nr:adenylyl cyclase [Verrucomicrobiota bacterium]